MPSGRGLYAVCMAPGFEQKRYEFGANTNAKLTAASGSKR